MELGFAANCDFYKLRNFVLYFFCDDEFRLLPDEAMQERLTADGKPISRQTIKRWLNRMEEKGLLSQTMGEPYYYCVMGDKRWEITAEQYRKGWAAYWEHINKGYSSREAFAAMIDVNSGIVKKKIIPLLNAIYNETIDTLVELAQKEIEKEIRSGLPE